MRTHGACPTNVHSHVIRRNVSHGIAERLTCTAMIWRNSSPAHPALRDVAGPPPARPVRGGRRLPVSAAQRAISHAGGSSGARVGLCLPYPPALAGTARTMADTRSPERPHALPALCQRAPGGHGRHPSGSHTVVESGTDRKPDQSPEDAEAPDVWPGTPRSAGPTLPIGGMTSA
jgi:hypothetical protein